MTTTGIYMLHEALAAVGQAERLLMDYGYADGVLPIAAYMAVVAALDALQAAANAALEEGRGAA